MSIQCPGDSFSSAKIFLYSLFFRGNKKVFVKNAIKFTEIFTACPWTLSGRWNGILRLWPLLLWSRSFRVLLCLKSRNDIIKLYPHPFRFGSIIVNERILAHRNIISKMVINAHSNSLLVSGFLFLKVFLFFWENQMRLVIRTGSKQGKLSKNFDNINKTKKKYTKVWLWYFTIDFAIEEK